MSNSDARPNKSNSSLTYIVHVAPVRGSVHSLLSRPASFVAKLANDWNAARGVAAVTRAPLSVRQS